LVKAVAFSRDGKRLFTIDTDDRTNPSKLLQHVRIWDQHSQQCLHSFDLDGGRVEEAVFSSDAKKLLLEYEDHKSVLIDSSTGQRLASLNTESWPEDPEPFGQQIVISDDNSMAVILNWRHGTRVYDLSTGSVLWTVPADSNNEIKAASYDPQSRHMFVSMERHILLPSAAGMAASTHYETIGVLYDAKKGTKIREWSLGSWDLLTLRGQPEEANEQGVTGISSARFVEDGHSIFLTTNNGGGALVSLDSDQRRDFKASGNPVEGIAVSADSKTLAVGISRGYAILDWDLASGRLGENFGPTYGASSRASMILSGPWLHLEFTPDAKLLVQDAFFMHFWDPATRSETRFPRKRENGYVNAISPDAALSLIDEEGVVAVGLPGRQTDPFVLTSTKTGEVIQTFPMRYHKSWMSKIFGPAPSVFSADGQSIVGIHSGTPCRLEIKTGLERCLSPDQETEVPAFAVSADGKVVVTAGTNQNATLWSTDRPGIPMAVFHDSAPLSTVVLSADHSIVVTGNEEGTIKRWKNISCKRSIGETLFQRPDCRLAWSAGAHEGPILASALFPSEKYLVTGGQDGSVRIWRAADGMLLATLLGDGPENWTVIGRDGRFDTSDVEHIRKLHWSVYDDPFKVLAPETYFRDYYEPRLLPRLLAGSAMPPVRNLVQLNRVPPDVKIESVRQGESPGEALVDVWVAGQTDATEGNRKTSTGAYDLRLFRNGQLVGQLPEPKLGSTGPIEIGAWREMSQLTPTLDGRTGLSHTFHVRLASADHGKPVVFTAYAFNEDRVKSESVRNDEYKVPENIVTRMARAYVLTIGINDYHAPEHDLEFAVRDALVMAKALGRIRGHDVVPITLVTDKAHDSVEAVSQATKANIRAIFEVLAGKSNASEEREQLRAAGIDAKAIAKLEKVTPDDAVIITYSGHGYTEPTGAFYLLPAGSWAGEKITPAALSEFISSDDLSEWLRDVDAGEIAMIIDACHSAASVDIPGFKPGPMGDRGLGQLAYDKGMRILAATQSDDVALEIRDLQEGLLTYALVEEGLTRDDEGKVRADLGGRGEVALSAWLKYGEQRTPGLYQDALEHKVKVKPKDSTIDPAFLPAFLAAQQKHAQTPALFDFQRLRESVAVQVEVGKE
jgi:WD40 repeat protein